MNKNKVKTIVLTILMAAAFPVTSVNAAGLDLDNQKEIELQNLDINMDTRITREEVGKYMFYYFDYDGNESLSRGEYKKVREITFLPYEGDTITFVDIDRDGLDDGTSFTTETFLQKVVIGEYDAEEEGIRAKDIMDTGYLQMDTDKSKYIEVDEWDKRYKKYAAKKGNTTPKAASQDRYGRD